MLMRSFKFLAVFLVLLLFGCGTQGGSSSTDTSTTDTTTPPVVTTVAALQISASPRLIGLNGTSAITVNLYNDGGQLINETNSVTFSLDNRDLASMIPIASTATGTLTRTLTAGSIAGVVTVTATSGGKSDKISIQITGDSVAANQVNVTATPASITVGGTSVVKAEVLDLDGNPMPDGTLVTFTNNNSGVGSIVASASTKSGFAQATFSASDTGTGIATITAESGTASGTATIEVLPATAGSIEFVSATPQIIVLSGTGGQETSIVQFLVKDSGGNPIAGSQEVNMTLSGPNGGEYIGATPGVTELQVGTVNGTATTTLHSGTNPGPVTITATVVGTLLSTSSGVIAIGGGVPSAEHFSLSTSRFNLEGLAVDNVEANIQILLADRYGNYNVLEGTSVSFYSECGAIDRAVNLDANGAGSVLFRTQDPPPINVPLTADDAALAAYYLDKLGVTINNSDNPRNGLCTITAVVDGEEEFNDSNGDGKYTSGEPFTDTYDDVFLDKDDDSVFDPTFEDLIVDANKNFTFDGYNGVWDGNKKIYKEIQLTMTGHPDEISVAEDGGIPVAEGDMITVDDGGSKKINFSIHDLNFNAPIGGTTFKVTADVGALAGKTTYTYPDIQGVGAPVFTVTLSDKTPGDANPPEIGTLTFTWTWNGIEYTYATPISVN